jgi:hypothetical protein
MTPRRVVITGAGIVSCIGNDLAAQPHFGHFRHGLDAAGAVAQSRFDRSQIIANAPCRLPVEAFFH